MESRNTNGSTAPSVTACSAPPLAVAMMSSCARATSPVAGAAAGMPMGRIKLIRIKLMRSPSRCALGGKARMNHGAIAGERGGLDDLVVPFDGERLLLLIHQDFEEGVEV